MNSDYRNLCEKARMLFAQNQETGRVFKDSSWRGFVFDRDKYDDTRVPEWFFLWLSESAQTEENIFICGSGEIFNSKFEKGVVRIPFSWEAYSENIKGVYSPELLVFDQSFSWALKMDPDLTIWGSEPQLHSALIDYLGGEDAILDKQFQEFGLNTENQEEFLTFLRTIINGPS